MLFLIVAFLAGGLILMNLAEDEELDEKRRINRMADRSRRGQRPAPRQRKRYTVAGLQAK